MKQRKPSNASVLSLKKRFRLISEAITDYQKGKLTAGAAFCAIDMIISGMRRPTKKTIDHAFKLFKDTMPKVKGDY